LNLWTIQASAKYSKKIINKYKNKKKLYCNDLLKTFCQLTGFEYKNITFKSIHGWKFSYNYKKTKYSSYWDKKRRLGICADWLLGPKAESAWCSARDLYKRIKKTPLIS
jgi:renalase